MSDKYCQFKLRVRTGLYWSLKLEAEKHGRSANEEAVRRLIASFIGKPKVRVPMGRAVV